jgi:hypothetical protein
MVRDVGAKAISCVTTIIAVASSPNCRITASTSPTNSGSSAEVMPNDAPFAEGPMVRRLTAGGREIRTRGPTPTAHLRRQLIGELRFARDSPLERGFEPSVPPRWLCAKKAYSQSKQYLFKSTRFRMSEPLTNRSQ